MMNFFRTINNFLQACSDYIDLRVKTGKFPEDIRYLKLQTKESFAKKKAAITKKIIQWKYTQLFLSFVQTQSRIIRKIPIIGDIFFLLAVGLKILLFYFFEVVLIFAFALISFFGLTFFFQNNPLLFSIALLPFLYCNVLFTGALYAFINKREQHLPATILDGIHKAQKTASALFMILCTHLFLSLAAVTVFFLSAFSLSLLFNAFQQVWENSFIYWIIIVPLLFLTLFTIAIFTIVCYHAYFFALFEQQKFSLTIRQTWQYLKGSIVQQFFFFFTVTICFIPIFSWSYTAYHSFGIAMALCIYGQTIVLLSYLLEKLFTPQRETFIDLSHTHISPLISFSFVVGFLTFVMTNALFMQQHTAIQEYLWQQQEDAAIAKGLNDYTNKEFRYTIQYPQAWTIYHWKTNETTFYNNYNGSQAGGIWVTISVHPIFSPDYNFEMLQNSKPGLVAYNTGTQTIVTKISDMDSDVHDGVVYSYSVPAEPFPQFQRHYLIKKDDQLFDIAFITLSKDVERRMSDIFERMIQSFQFLEEDHSQQGSL